MGETDLPTCEAHYFIQLNPNYSDGAAALSSNPLWIAAIIEVGSDSIPAPVDGYSPTTLEDIHALGLLSPSESRKAAMKDGDYDGQESFGRRWGSWINAGYRTQALKYATCGSGTYRTWVPGGVAVRCSTLCSGQVIWNPPWQGAWGYGIAIQRTWAYPSHATFTWRHFGWHSWYSGSNESSYLLKEW
uniref:Uncharacterized protein n=1 Tax=candidate division WOR-3 bacterium TaxID=2052148 RepID=A0A7C4GI53_UNCW3